MERLKRHEEGSDRLEAEVDILQFLHAQRLTNFLAKLFLRRHQRTMIYRFKKYQLEIPGTDLADTGRA